MDFHVHLAPTLGPERLRQFGVTSRDGLYEVDGVTIGPRKLYDPVALVAYLIEVGLDAGLVSPSPPLFRQQLDAEEGADWVRALNLGMIEATQQHAQLHPLVYLPLEHPEVAIAEFEFFRRHPAVTGWTAAAGGRSAPMDSEPLDELWRRMDESAEWVFLHPGTTQDARLGRKFLGNVIGNPVESAVAVGELVFGDVLFWYPRLRFMVAHCGGAFPALVGRWQRAVDAGLAGSALAPADAVRRLYVDTVIHGDSTLAAAVSTLGADRIVFGSDWPYPMGVDDPVAEIAGMPADQRELVSGQNGHSLLGQRRTVVSGDGQ